MSKKLQVKAGSVSWIHQQVTPVKFLTDGKLYEPNWIPQTYIGLYATRNTAPGANLDLNAHRASKQFRSMTFADLTVETSDDAKDILNVTLEKSFLDPGWTPPFDRTITFLTQIYVPEPSMRDPTFHAGELGNGSAISLRKRHPNSTIGLSVPTVNIVANALILFRAGSKTDDIGVNVVKCPYHVPWVWCEWLLTFDAGRFAIFGTGSVFPTHTFYAQGSSYGQQDEPTDAGFVTSWRHPLTIDTSALRVYPVLTTGAPAIAGSVNVKDTTQGAAGIVTSLPYVVASSGYSSATVF
jgi:hypothetical protein